MGDKESLKKAFEGAYAVFGVTNFWESASKAVEVGQGHNIADAAKESGVKLFVWSSLPHVTKCEYFVLVPTSLVNEALVSDGKLPHVEHFDGKAEIGDYARSIGLPTAEFQPGFYFSNLKMMMRKDEEGDAYTLAWPFPADTGIDFFDAANDTGKFVAGILANPKAYIGKEVLGTTAKYTPNDVCREFKAVTGKECKYVEVTDDQWKQALPLPPPLNQELLENMILIRDYGYYGKHAQQALDFSRTVPRGKLTTLSEAIKEMSPW